MMGKLSRFFALTGLIVGFVINGATDAALVGGLELAAATAIIGLAVGCWLEMWLDV